MAEITVSTDQLIEHAVDLERDKQSVLADIAEHRDDCRRLARQANDKEFTAFVENFYAQKKRGETVDPKTVEKRQTWKREFLKSYGVDSNGSEADAE